MSIAANNFDSRSATSEIEFLIVDDDRVSVMAIQRALKKLKILNPVLVAKDGVEALEILEKAKDTNGSIPPYLITLDINMPRMGGLEFLEVIRKDPILQKILIFVLSTSDAPKDIASAYSNNIAGYIVKDDLSVSISNALEMIGAFSRIVEIPK